MTQRDRRRLLWAINLILGGALVAVTAWALTPLDRAADAGPPRRQVGAATPPPQAPHEPLTSYAVIFGRDLRRPLYDTKPRKVVAARPLPKFTYRLTGTVIEPGFSFAVFRSPSGKVKMVRAGQVIEGAEVVSIARTSVELKRQGRLITVPVVKRTPSAGKRGTH